jgi:1-acyl-sn-glycerol-3-phosphate acyltransferase
VLDFCDQPYRWFPPRDGPLLGWLLRAYNRARHLPRTLRIESVRVSGGERLPRGPGALLFTPNHPTHADAAIVIEALRAVGRSARFMAAYDVFLRRRLDAFVMQRLGAFSVDREGSDKRAMECALESLTSGGRSLVIYPEGNVYLQNDRVTPFHDGAAHLALKAVAPAGAGGPPVHIVPVSIKVTHKSDVRPLLRARLAELARALECAPAHEDDPRQALAQVGLTALRRNLRLRGMPAPEGETLAQLIEHSAGTVLARLEEKLQIAIRPRDGLIDRVRRARRVIHEVRTDPARVADHAAAATWADEAMVAFRIVSYSGAYVAERPSIDRVAETVEKLGEDIESRMLPPIGPRVAAVRLGPPIAVAELTAGRRQREAVRALTEAAEAAVQAGVDELNRENREAGSRLWAG